MPTQWAPLDFSRHSIREIYVNGLKIPPPDVLFGEVHQTEYMHDMFVFQMVWPDSRLLTSASGWLVQMRWGASDQQNSFYGYVQSASMVESRGGPLGNADVVQFMCLGSTSVMQNGVGRNFAGMSADNVVKSVVQPYHLAVVADSSPFLFPNLVQARLTDWQFLCKLARSIGYVLTSDKVTIYFIDPLRIVQNTGYSVSIVSTTSGAPNPSLLNGSMTVGAKNNIAAFTNTVVRGVDVMGVAVQAASLNDVRLSLLGANTVEPTTTRYDQDTQPASAQHAQVIAQASNRPESWPLQYQLTAKGDGRIRPGVLTAIHAGDNDISGLWVVRSAIHYLGRASYTVDVTAARDATTNSPYPTPTITVGNRSGPLNSVAAPVVTNGKWASIWSA